MSVDPELPIRPNSASKFRPKLTRTPLIIISVALFLLFALPAVGLAIDNYQRTPKVLEYIVDMEYGPPDPRLMGQRVPATPAIVVAWTRLSIAELFIASAAVILS